jgi:serine/threonine protein kinase
MPSTTGIRRRLSPALLTGAPFRIGDRMAERYVVKDAIGIGPLGYVFRAADEQQGIDVAVKMIHPRFVQTAEEREAFSRAVEPARRFMQPSLARIHDLGVEQGWPFITYSFLDGLTLRRMIDSRLAKGQTFTLEEVEPFLGQLAAALEATHALGAHADLKPENVVILPDMLRVVDWGVARGLPRLPFVQAQKQKSTHRYLAPELVAGGEMDSRADLYSLGVLVGEMLTGLTPDDDIPELRLTAPELPEALEGFYRRALNERPEARFRSVRELYEDFVALLAPAAAPTAAPVATAEVPGEVPAAEAEAVVEDLEPISDGSEAVVAPTPATAGPVAAPPADPGTAPIAAAALPRFESPAVETPRHTREVVALDPPEWTGTGPASTDASRQEGERWSSLRLWDAESDAEGEERAPRPSAAEATGPELPVNTQPARALVGSVPPPPVSGLAASEEEAERAVAGLTEIDGPVLDEEGHDEPLLAEALGVDLVVDGDEPVPEPVGATPAAGSPVSGTSPVPATPTPVPVSESSVHEISPLAATPTPVAAPEPVESPRHPASATPPPSSIREVPRLVPESRPWNTEARPPPYRRESGDGPRTREAPTLAARSGLPPAPSIPPLRSAVPRLSPVEPPAAAGTSPTPLSVVPEPSPTRQERVVAPPPPPEALAISTPMGTPVAPARGAGSWSPAELLAQVIAEIQAEERGAGLPRGGGWEPVPLDATQPISTDEVAARLAAAEAHRPARMSVAASDDEDLPAMRHEAGRAGMRMALLTAVGLIIGLLGGWTLFKLVHKPPRPQVEQISEVRSSGQAPAAR